MLKAYSFSEDHIELQGSKLKVEEREGRNEEQQQTNKQQGKTVMRPWWGFFSVIRPSGTPAFNKSSRAVRLLAVSLDVCVTSVENYYSFC